MARCENVILDNLPFGFVSLKSKAKVQVERDQDYTEEYKTPIGGSVGQRREPSCSDKHFLLPQVDIVCKQTFQRITIDEWDLDPDDMKMTVMCLPTFRYSLPRENFPKVFNSVLRLKREETPYNFPVQDLLPEALRPVEQNNHGQLRTSD